MRDALARQMLALSKEFSAQMGSPRSHEVAERTVRLRMK